MARTIYHRTGCKLIVTGNQGDVPRYMNLRLVLDDITLGRPKRGTLRLQTRRRPLLTERVQAEGVLVGTSEMDLRATAGFGRRGVDSSQCSYSVNVHWMIGISQPDLTQKFASDRVR